MGNWKSCQRRTETTRQVGTVGFFDLPVPIHCIYSVSRLQYRQIGSIYRRKSSIYHKSSSIYRRNSSIYHKSSSIYRHNISIYRRNEFDLPSHRHNILI